MLLQQCLPFTVLKPDQSLNYELTESWNVATVLTVYGIETATASVTASLTTVSAPAASN